MITVNRIKELRTARGMNQEELGKVLKISGRAIGNYEREIRDIDNEALKILADFFKVSTDYLLGHSDFNTVVTREEAELYKVGEEDKIFISKLAAELGKKSPKAEIIRNLLNLKDS